MYPIAHTSGLSVSAWSSASGNGWAFSRRWKKRIIAILRRRGRGRPGLSWFKPAAVDHIKQMHSLKVAVEECGVHVEIITTREPGTMIWQDEHQIVADPGKRKF